MRKQVYELDMAVLRCYQGLKKRGVWRPMVRDPNQGMGGDQGCCFQGAGASVLLVSEFPW